MNSKRIVIGVVLLILCFCVIGCNQTGDCLPSNVSETDENVSSYITDNNTETHDDNLTHNNYYDSSVIQGNESNDESGVSSVMDDTSQENYSSEVIGNYSSEVSENTSSDDIIPPKVTDNGEIELPDDIWN